MPLLSTRMYRLSRALLVLMLLALILPTATPTSFAAGTTYYVDSVAGNDGNAGTAPNVPWKTLTPVHARTFQPGDTLYFKRGSVFTGSYWPGGLVIDDSGTADAPITFTVYGDGPRPIFQAAGEWTRAISLNASWIVLDGLAARGAHEFGVHVAPGSDHNVMRDMEIWDVGMGFGVFGQHNLITQNYVRDLKMVNNTPGGDDDYGAVAVILYASYNEVSYNRMERCSAPSYDYTVDGGAVELYGNVTGSYIHHNWAQDSAGFLEVGGGSAIDTVVEYNVSLNNGMFTYVHLSGTFGSNVRNLRVEHNTVVEPGSGWIVFGFGGASPTADTFLLRNNLFYIGNYSRVVNTAGHTHEHNLYRLTSGSTQLGFTPTGSEILADPQLMDIAGGNLRLSSSSPAIDAGTLLSQGPDMDGRPVPQGGAPDLGAYESDASAVTPTPEATVSPTAEPTATSSPTTEPTMAPSPTAEPTLTPTPAPTKAKNPRNPRFRDGIILPHD